MWPKDFIKQIQTDFPNQADAFIQSLNNTVVPSIKTNPLKPATINFLANSTPVAWYNQGFLLQQRPQFTADPLFSAGAYYVQESSSMFLAHVLLCLKESYNISSALDMCAAPGGKTTLLQSVLGQDVAIVANEIIKSRVGVLVQNIQKWGMANALVVSNDPKDIAASGITFDLVLTDAPCSGEGLFRRDANAAKEWNTANVYLCAQRQQRILHEAVKCVKPGGFLIYSTCTFNTKENEDNVNWLVKNYGFKTVAIPVEPTWQITQLQENCYRFLPHCVPGEGLFICVLQKPGDGNDNKALKQVKLNEKPINNFNNWLKNANYFYVLNRKNKMLAIPKVHYTFFNLLQQRLNVSYMPIELGEVDKKGLLIPSHALALSVFVSSNIASIEVNAETALLYLRKQPFILPHVIDSGWCLVNYKQLSLGFIKVLKNRVNNYYPTDWRILKAFEPTIN
jgi:16S rRNA C967 or C1407 C5-methylase (RsmB/RsmF family)/NOL1/NOP2/fmu family ribosome biogenesis protein